ncbi:MAG: hypothetical protein BMS9Abin05_1564 [Rhodothermia bacterium]|nr:MAG: hypothetical protein BMS9Abin05_1564 [Rhodothermia bacterium]
MADVDNDGDFDVLYTGNSRANRPFGPVSGIAINQFTGVEVFGSIPFDLTRLSSETWLGHAAWSDYDLDGDLDFILTGTASADGPYPSTAMLYRNDGLANFAEVDVGLEGVHSSITRWVDYDNDGDSDLVLSGRISDGTHSIRLYRNEGSELFSEVSTPFPQLAFGDVAWADYDTDGDYDVLVTGTREAGQFMSLLYRNDGNGEFTLTPDVFASLAFSSAAWGDYDSDGDPDLILSGAELGVNEAFVGNSYLYRNDGGSFVERPDEFVGVFNGDQAWADYDLDGDLDLFVMGRTSMLGNHIAYIYQNNDGEFRIVTGLVGTSTANSVWADFDGDNDIDVLVTGLNLTSTPFTKLYRNVSRLVNTPPLPPDGLSAIVGSGEATLSWNPGSDVHTATPALTYSLRVGTAPGSSDVMSSMSSAETGRRWTPGLGNVQQNTSWTLRSLPVGLYYWSVQSVDNSFIGSAFAEESQFSVTTGAKVSTGTDDSSDLPRRTELNPIFPNPFNQSATISFEIAKSSSVRLAIYDLLGKRVRVLADGLFGTGRHQVDWDGNTDSGSPMGSGIYFARMETDGKSTSRKIVLLR